VVKEVERELDAMQTAAGRAAYLFHSHELVITHATADDSVNEVQKQT
jgi:hypothetical protein